jgi:hypothetical protein
MNADTTYTPQHPRAGELAQLDSLVRHLRAGCKATGEPTALRVNWARTARKIVATELRKLVTETERSQEPAK